MRWTETLASGLLEVAPDAIVVSDSDGGIVFANAAARAMFGADDLVGASVDVLVPPANPPMVERVRAYLGATQPDKRVGQPLRAVRRDGTLFSAEITLSVVEGHIFAVLHDLSGQTGADRARSLLASIVQSSHDAIVSTDLDGLVLSWNPGAERLYGYTAGEMLGRSKDLIIPPSRRADEAEIRTIVAAGGRVDPYRTSASAPTAPSSPCRCWCRP